MTVIETPAFKKESSCILLWILSVSKLIDVNMSSDGVNVISVPVSFEAFTFLSFAVGLPPLYFCKNSPPSLQTLSVSSLDKALTTETPTP